MKEVLSAFVADGFAKELCGRCGAGCGYQSFADSLKSSFAGKRHFRNGFSDYAADSVAFALSLIFLSQPGWPDGPRGGDRGAREPLG